MSDSSGPLTAWLAAHAPDDATGRRIAQWLNIRVELEEALVIEEQYEHWVAHHDGSEPPDLVKCASSYGLARAILDTWRELPVSVPEQERGVWREAGFLPTLDEMYARCAGVAGGFLDLCGQRPDASMELIRGQLTRKLADLSALCDIDLADYTPQSWSYEEISEGSEDSERFVFEQPFFLRDQLEGFGVGFEKLRLLSVTEKEESLGLPNWSLHAAMAKCDLNEFWLRIGECDEGLRAILEHLEGHDYEGIDAPTAPEGFWWRQRYDRKIRRKRRGRHKDAAPSPKEKSGDESSR